MPNIYLSDSELKSLKPELEFVIDNQKSILADLQNEEDKEGCKETQEHLIQLNKILKKIEKKL